MLRQRTVPRDQASTNGSKHARSSASTSRRSLSSLRDYPRGTDTVTKPKFKQDLVFSLGNCMTH